MVWKEYRKEITQKVTKRLYCEGIEKGIKKVLYGRYQKDYTRKTIKRYQKGIDKIFSKRFQEGVEKTTDIDTLLIPFWYFLLTAIPFQYPFDIFLSQTYLFDTLLIPFQHLLEYLAFIEAFSCFTECNIHFYFLEYALQSFFNSVILLYCTSYIYHNIL